jgi:hypothetical protein
VFVLGVLFLLLFYVCGWGGGGGGGGGGGVGSLLEGTDGWHGKMHILYDRDKVNMM